MILPYFQTLEKEPAKNFGTEFFFNKERMNVQFETDFVKMKATDVNLNGFGNGNLCLDGDYKNAIFIFGDRSKEICAFLERMAYMKKRVC